MTGNQKLLKFLDLFSYIFLIINVVAIPLFLDRNLMNYYVIPKQYAFICLLLINVILFVAKMILSKTLSFKKSVMDLPILALLLMGLFSSIFSLNNYDSFLGRSEYFILNYIFLVFLAIFYFLITNFIHTKTRWSGLLDALIFTGGFTALLFVIKSVFKLNILGWVFPGAINSVDMVNTPFGIWLVLILMLSAGMLFKKSLSVGKSIVYFSVTILALVSLILLSFKLLWWVLLGALIILLLVGVSHIKDVRLGWVSTLFAMLVLVVVFIAFGTPRYMQTAVPAEISLGSKPSWHVSSKTVFSGPKNFIVGSGLGTFNVNFSKHRSIDFNSDPWAWSLRFSQPFSTFFAVLAEGGMIMLLLLIFIALFGLGHVFNIWFKRNNTTGRSIDIDEDAGQRIDGFVVAGAWLVLTVAMGLVFFGPVLWWFWWLLLALMIVGLSFFQPTIIKTKTWTVEDTPQYSMTFSFVMIVLLAGLIMVGVWGARLYMAEIAYGKAVVSSNYDDAQQNLQTALYQRGSSDLYHAALAQVYLMQAVKLVNEGTDDLQLVSAYVAQAVNEARIASDLSPRSVAIWENLAIMYENAAVIVPEAREWAIKSWLRAYELEPTNPVLAWRLGNNYAISENMEEAVKYYKESIRLKGDYLDAYIGLSRVYEMQNKIDDAVESYKQALSYGGSNNAALLFDFGRLLYNRNKDNDRDDAEILWLNSVRLQPNYSNALYSLALLYEAKGDKTTALQYYYKVRDLNPDNEDVTAKIRSLIGASVPREE